MNVIDQLLSAYGFEQTPCGPWQRPVADSKYGEMDYVILPSDRPGFATERTGTYHDSGRWYDDKTRTISKPGQGFEDFMLQEFGPVPEKKTYAREEVIDLLKTLYAKAAESYNVYRMNGSEFKQAAEDAVAEFMTGR